MSKWMNMTLLLIVCLLGLIRGAHAEDVVVQITDAPATGTVYFALFDSANTFGDFRDPVLKVHFPFDGRASYRLAGVAPGEYALLVYHDEDNNGQLDRNFIGIPREPLGFSNGYRPKGPPSYERAAFGLRPGEQRTFTMQLAKPLGERGRIAAGVGILARSSPYRGYKGSVYQVIPALTYTGERLQIFGPRVQMGLIGSGRLRVAATGEYRIGVYEEDDSAFLEGMGDAESTFMAGLSLQSELPGGIDVSLSYAHDALDRIGGGEARIGVDKSFQTGPFRVAPKLSLNWVSARLADSEFGVPPDKALPQRPAYEPGDVLSPEIGAGLFIDITRDWLVVVDAGVEFLDTAVKRSPIVDKDYVVKGFAAASYLF